MLLPKKQNKKNYKSLSGIYLKSRHESPANSSDKSESVNCAKALQYARLPGSLTVEAAFVVPWIILAAIVLCSLFSVLRGELYMSAALHNAARIMAAEVTEIEHKENISDDVPADTNTTDIIDIVKNEKAGITDSESKAVEKYRFTYTPALSGAERITRNGMERGRKFRNDIRNIFSGQ